MNIKMSNDIDAAIKHCLDGGRVLAKISSKDGGDKAICEIEYNTRFSEWDCVSPASNLKEIDVLCWAPIDVVNTTQD